MCGLTRVPLVLDLGHGVVTLLVLTVTRVGVTKDSGAQAGSDSEEGGNLHLEFVVVVVCGVSVRFNAVQKVSKERKVKCLKKLYRLVESQRRIEKKGWEKSLDGKTEGGPREESLLKGPGYFGNFL